MIGSVSIEQSARVGRCWGRRPVTPQGQGEVIYRNDTPMVPRESHPTVARFRSSRPGSGNSARSSTLTPLLSSSSLLNSALNAPECIWATVELVGRPCVVKKATLSGFFHYLLKPRPGNHQYVLIEITIKIVNAFP
jgi:hypothetical protein